MGTAILLTAPWIHKFVSFLHLYNHTSTVTYIFICLFCLSSFLHGKSKARSLSVHKLILQWWFWNFQIYFIQHDSSCWFSLYIIPSETSKCTDFIHSNFLDPFWYHMKLMMHLLFGRCSWIVLLFSLVLFSFSRKMALCCLISFSSGEYSISC